MPDTAEQVRVARRGGSRRLAAAAALLAALSLALFWPGYAMYDTVVQFAQVTAGRYDDWHPPIMARLWAAIGGGTAPMLAIQLTGYWGGLGAIAAALARIGRGRAGAAVLVLGAIPLFVGWQAVVLKDAQLVAALLGATGLVAWWRLRGRAMPGAAIAAAALLLGYALLVRANAVFAAAPLVAMLAPRPARAPGKAGLALLLVAATLALAPPINHHLLAAKPSGVERTQPLYDLAGIAIHSDPPTLLTIPERDALVARHCVKPWFWDSLDEPRCAPALARLSALPPPRLYVALAGEAARHPLAYLQHRLSQLNATMRWLVPAHFPEGGPPDKSEPNAAGLGATGPGAALWQRVAGWTAETPLGWPIAWLVLAATLAAAAIRLPRAPARDLALALLASALTLEASFAAISIASDLRYHLWPMLATGLAAVLLGRAATRARRVMVAGGVVLAVVLAAGIAARLVLPPLPVGYQALVS